MTVSTRGERGAALRRGEQEVERLGRGDDEGARAAGPWPPARWRWCRRCGPPTVRSGAASPSCRAFARSRPAAAPGSRRCRRPAPSAARRRRPSCRSTGWPRAKARYRRLIAMRKPASVLPDPVGAATRVCSPAAMDGQAASCAGVGPSGKRSRNQAATAGCSSTVGSSVVSTVTALSSTGSNSDSCVGADTSSPYVRGVTPLRGRPGQEGDVEARVIVRRDVMIELGRDRLGPRGGDHDIDGCVECRPRSGPCRPRPRGDPTSRPPPGAPDAGPPAPSRRPTWPSSSSGGGRAGSSARSHSGQSSGSPTRRHRSSSSSIHAASENGGWCRMCWACRHDSSATQSPSSSRRNPVMVRCISTHDGPRRRRPAVRRARVGAGHRRNRVSVVARAARLSGMSLGLVALCVDANDPLGSRGSGRRRCAGRSTTRPLTGSASCRPTARGSGSTSCRVPEPKVGPNRLHLDLTTTSLDDQRESAARLVELGGRHIDIGQRPEEDHVVLADPEGNEFCLIEPTNNFLAGLRAPRSDHLRRDEGGRVLLERRARLAAGLGSGRGDRDPGSRPHRPDDHLGRPAGGPEARQEPAATSTSRRSRDPTQHAEVDRLLALGATRIDIGQGDVDGSSCSTPTATSSAVRPVLVARWSRLGRAPATARWGTRAGRR